MALPSSINAPTGSASSDPGAQAPKVTTDGNPPNPQDRGKGDLFPKADPPPSRQFIGTTPGNGGTKPYKVR